MVLACGAYLVVGGLLSLAGWVFNIPRLTDWYKNGISIQPNATLCVLCSGLSLVCSQLGRRRAAVAWGCVVLAIGGLTGLEWLSGVSFGIDELLLFERPFGRVGVVYPGRMGPPGTTSWTLLGLSLCLTHTATRGSHWALTLAIATAGISSLSLIGYLYGVSQLYALPYLTVIALQTSTFVLAASVGILACHPGRQPLRTLLERDSVGDVARRALPLLVLGPVFLGWLRVRGQDAGLYDTGFGTALLVLTLVLSLLGLLYWSLASIRLQEQRERDVAARLSDTLESISDGFFSVNAEWQFVYVNAAFEAACKLDRRAVLGRRFEEVFPDVVGTPLYYELRRCAREQTPVELENYYPPWGRWFLVRSYPTPEGGFSQYFHDISARKQVEQERQEADRRKDEFLATLAHELRNPLAPVRSGIQLLRLPGHDLQAVAEVVEMMDRQVNHIVRLVDDLLEVSRITRGKIELRKETIDVAAIVRSAVETAGPVIEQAGHRLEINLPGQPLLVDADPVRLAQVLGNLLHNAAKYTDAGGRISLTVLGRADRVQLIVRDNGTGIPVEMLPRVFDLFTQVDRTLGRAQGGLGIGLALVKSLVQMHGGTVTACSNGPGAGSEFTVELPLAASRTTAPTPATAVPAPVAAAARRILIVDDNRDAANVLAMVLRALGAQVRTVYDGPSALEAIRADRPNVAFVDLGMPGMDGFAVAEQVRSEPQYQQVTLVALTGWGQADDRRKTQAAGFDHHLTKPVDLPAVQAVLAAAATHGA